MKLTVEHSALANALKKVSPVAPQKATIPILQNIKIAAEGGTVHLTATNLDIEVTVKVAANVMTGGAITVPAKMFTEIVAKSKSGSLIEIEYDGNQATVKAGRAKAKLATLDATDYPHIASTQYKTSITVPAAELAQLFAKTVFAASTEETRYYLNGVYLTMDDGFVSGVATDGHRFARQRTAIDTVIPSVIVPSSTIKAAQLPDDGDVVVSISDTKIRLETADWVLVSKVIDGTYPDYTRILPTASKTTARFDGTDMKRAVERTGVVLDRATNAVVFDVDDGAINISGNNNGHSISDVIDCELTGEPIRIGFNAKYIIDVMNRLDGNALMTFNTAGDPALLQDDANDGWTGLIMPMRVA